MGASASKATESLRSRGPAIPIDEENPAHNRPGTVEHFTSEKDGETFTKLVKTHTPYGKLFQCSVGFEIYINRKGLHWYLLARMENAELPFVTFEIVTDDGKTIIAVVCLQDDDTGKEHCTSLETTMEELCSIADTTRNQMGRYNLMNCNCQHFCNAFLSSFPRDVVPFQTTVGPQVPSGLPIDNGSVAMTDITTDFDASITVKQSLSNRLS